MQIPLRTSSSVDAYIRNREWRDVRLPACPMHPSGGCSFARHGSYERSSPSGLRIARWYCPEGQRTFSLIPDFLASRLPGLLHSIEESIVTACAAKSREAAADLLRGPDVTLPSAVRWLRRRIGSVRASLDAVRRKVPGAFIGALEKDFSGISFDAGSVLLGLRRSLSPQILSAIPAPLGFERTSPWRGCRVGDHQHRVGTDGQTAQPYVDRIPAPCESPSIKPPQSRPPPRTSSVSGVPTVACKRARPRSTFSGSGCFAPIWCDTS
jgi:hypothetical protein